MRTLLAAGRSVVILGAAALAGVAPALAAPAASRGQQFLPITQEECLRRATSALQTAGYTLWGTLGNGPWGDKGPHVAVIFCEPGQGTEIVDIVVATEGTRDGNVPGAERVRLQELIAAGGTGAVQGAAGRYASVERAGQGLVVRWRDLPSYPSGRNWLAVVPASKSDEDYGAVWTYTDAPAGTFELPALPSGDYEVRLFFNWPTAGYTVAERVRFRIP